MPNLHFPLFLLTLLMLACNSPQPAGVHTKQLDQDLALALQTRATAQDLATRTEALARRLDEVQKNTTDAARLDPARSNLEALTEKIPSVSEQLETAIKQLEDLRARAAARTVSEPDMQGERNQILPIVKDCGVSFAEYSGLLQETQTLVEAAEK